jgi:hypothetical protein
MRKCARDVELYELNARITSRGIEIFRATLIILFLFERLIVEELELLFRFLQIEQVAFCERKRRNFHHKMLKEKMF